MKEKMQKIRVYILYKLSKFYRRRAVVNQEKSKAAYIKAFNIDKKLKGK